MFPMSWAPSCVLSLLAQSSPSPTRGGHSLTLISPDVSRIAQMSFARPGNLKLRALGPTSQDCPPDAITDSHHPRLPHRPTFHIYKTEFLIFFLANKRLSTKAVSKIPSQPQLRGPGILGGEAGLQIAGSKAAWEVPAVALPGSDTWHLAPCIPWPDLWAEPRS